MDLKKKNSIEKAIEEKLELYFKEIENHDDASGLYDMVLSHVEPILFKVILEKYQGNQTKASSVLGISRNTFRKKLILYNLL